MSRSFGHRHGHNHWPLAVPIAAYFPSSDSTSNAIAKQEIIRVCRATGGSFPGPELGPDALGPASYHSTTVQQYNNIHYFHIKY